MQSTGQILSLFLRERKPFVAYRLPTSAEICLLKADTVEPFGFSGQDVFSAESFLVVPFDNEHRQAYLLKGKTQKLPFEAETETTTKPSENANSPCPDDYREAFAEMHSAIRSGEISKVVLSRQHRVEGLSAADAPDCFLRFCAAQPSAFVYLLCLPDASVWLGASPELFLRRDVQSVETVSLAGTMPSGVGQGSWGKKETDEQDIVTEYIAEQLQQFGIRNIVQKPATTISAGQVAHLQTRFRFPLSDLQANIGGLIAALHPTPAVCGYPKEAAKRLILDVESHERELYSGFLGKIEADGNFCLYVNIRCMQFFEKEAKIYVGGGITQASDVQAEFDETVLKAESLIKNLKT